MPRKKAAPSAPVVVPVSEIEEAGAGEQETAKAPAATSRWVYWGILGMQVLFVLAVAFIAAKSMGYLPQAVVGPTSALRSTLQGETAAADSKCISAFYGALADLVDQDALRVRPVFLNAQGLLECLHLAGHHQIGPGWTIGDRYPQFVDEAFKCLQSVDLADSGDLTPEDKHKIAGQLRFISREVGP